MRHVAVGLSILSLLTLTVAFAKPKDQVLEDRQRATIVVTIDVSLSMEATDVEPTRLEAAKTAASAFVTTLPPKFNVSLVSFAGTATTVGPADPRSRCGDRRDRGAAAPAVDGHRRGHLHLAGGAQPGAAGSRTTRTPTSRPDRAAQRRQDPGRPGLRSGRPGRPDQNVPIYTIAYGTEDGYIEVGGRREPVPVDRVELQRVAKISGGEAYTAESRRAAERGLQGHRQLGRQGEGRPGGDLPVRRLRSRLRHPGGGRDDVAGCTLALIRLAADPGVPSIRSTRGFSPARQPCRPALSRRRR